MLWGVTIEVYIISFQGGFLRRELATSRLSGSPLSATVYIAEVVLSFGIVDSAPGRPMLDILTYLISRWSRLSQLPMSLGSLSP